MCGISGIINKANEKVSESDIHLMNDIINHRGPDGEGFYYGNNFAFAHRRLSILDLSDDGSQPMSYLDEQYVITYNGEIYNYIELREELESCGYSFNSDTDTEVLLASYDKWGEDCVNKFNGMWAFAIYDKKKNIIFCSRDRFGIKPFYYTEINGKFIFGSEIKQLLCFFEDTYVDKNILLDYLVLGFEEHTNRTFFEGINKLEQSHNMIYKLSDNSKVIKKYYDIREKITDKQVTIEQYKDLLFDAIKLRMRSDVTVGSCLSGGLDSSSVASIASSFVEKGNKFVSIHAKSSEKNSDESHYAQEVSKHCDIDLSIIKPTEDDFINLVDEVVYTQEEPFGSPSIFMQYLVMKKAKEINCTVLLDGQGGDETLLGYERYYPAYLLQQSIFSMPKHFFKIVNNSKLSFKTLLQYCIYFSSYSIRKKRVFSKYSFIKNKYLNLISKDVLKKNTNAYSNLFRLQYLEIFKTQMPHLLKYEDKNSMRNSIETRLPFIDYRVLEQALSLSINDKIKKGFTKYALRKAVDKILPTNVVWRKNKIGFEAPTKTWLDSHKKNIHKAIAESGILTSICLNIPYDNMTDIQLWKFYNVAVWEKIYQVKMKN